MEIESLQQFYQLIEDRDRLVRKDFELIKALTKFSRSTDDEDVRKTARWEIAAFEFLLNEGVLSPVFETTKEDGTTYAYPSYNDFEEAGLQYLSERAGATKNEYLIARYNQILWNICEGKKHQGQAKSAIDAYLRVLNVSEDNTYEFTDTYDLLSLLKNGISLSWQVHYRSEEFRRILNRWLFEQTDTQLKISALSWMSKTKGFQKRDFVGCSEIILTLNTTETATVLDTYEKEQLLQVGLRIAKRTGSPTKSWHSLIGDRLMDLVEFRMDDESRIVPLSYCTQAITHYKKSGDKKKLLNAEIKYGVIKKQVKLESFHIKLSDEEARQLSDDLDRHTAKIMSYDPKDIYGFLLQGRGIFPTHKSVMRAVADRKPSFMDFGKSMKLDINQNVSERSSSKEGQEKERIYEDYMLKLQMWTHPFLHRVFIEGIVCGKLNAESLLQFFRNHTWLGQELTDYDSGHEPIQYNWLGMLAPSILEYFAQTESALKSNNPYTNYIMPIDSLTLKFEGVLREFAKRIGVRTSIEGRNGQLREMYIEELLTEPKIQSLFDTEDMLLFNYLFVVENGMNLRNNIAHSFYRFDNYSFQIVHLLICAFLRLGKYKFSEDESGQLPRE